MRLFRAVLPGLALILGAIPCSAQKWEIGGGFGGSFYDSQTVKNAVRNGDATLSDAVGASLWLGNRSYRLLGGEIRYDYENTKLQVAASGTQARFGADTHAIHYDFLFHLASREARLKPYVSAGGGAKVFRGTGKETAFQPLANLALLTKTTEVTGLLSIGAGLKFAITPNVQVRAEVRDAFTPFPSKVIAPAQGSTINGWLQDLTVLVGLSLTF